MAYNANADTERWKKQNKEIEEKKKEIPYHIQIEIVMRKNEYITNLLNGNYFLARYNMMVEQLNKNEIIEKIDGILKSRELMVAESSLMKMQAIKSMRNAFFAKKDLKEKYKLTDEDIKKIEEDYYNGRIIREDYGDEYKPRNKAEFVKPA
jgi:hypothetical protein